MKWQSAHEIDSLIAAFNDPHKLFRVYALSLYADKAFYSADFEPSEAWADLVIVTPDGQKILDCLHASGIKNLRHLEIFALFCLFYHTDILIDYEKTDEKNIILLLAEMHRTGQARWPYVFGNLLYNKFNDLYDGNRTATLDSESSELLLSGTPQGVFQVGTVLSGPLGFIISTEERTIPPILRLPLWHCSDTGCNAPPFVALENHKSSICYIKKIFARHIADCFGPSSEWHRPLLRIYRNGRWNNGRPYIDLPAVISDCIIGKEREALFLRAFRSPHNKLISSILKNTKSLSGPPEDIVKNLTQEELHQLILILPDKELVNFIDELICSKNIKIPPTELRKAMTYTHGISRDTGSRLSSFGIRSVGHPPIIELGALIWTTYEELGLTEELEWRVRGHSGSTLRHSVIDFIRSHGPQTAVRELILPSRLVTTEIGNYSTFQVWPEEDEGITCSRVLWKLGFNLPRYEDEYTILRNRISEFSESVLILPSAPNEAEKAKIRSVGVNLFVSVEHFLEYLLVYNTWILSSDHFTGTGFCYRNNEAFTSVSKALGSQFVSGQETINWKEDGTNTLGVLLGYLNVFRSWLRGRATADKSIVSQNEEDYPHYANDTLWVFPFKHKELWADISPEGITAYVEVFEKICVQLAQADLAVVRNGLDHKRDEDSFPDADKMLACATRLQQVIDTADSYRLIPKLYWRVKAEYDADGNSCNSFADYRNNIVPLWEPSPVLGMLNKRTFSVPYLIAPFDLLNIPNSTLVFKISSRSEYASFWKNYPRRRKIPKGKKDLESAVFEQYVDEQMD